MKTIILILLAVFAISDFVYADVQHVKIASDSAKDKKYYYNIPIEQLPINITEIKLNQQYNFLGKKYLSSIVIKYSTDEKSKANYPELYKIELITKKDPQARESITTIPIRRVARDGHGRLVIYFEYSLPEDVFKKSKLKFYLRVRNPGEVKNFEYVIDANKLKENKLRI